jgi:hypothetical protein
MGRIEQTLLDGVKPPIRAKTAARKPSISQKVMSVTFTPDSSPVSHYARSFEHPTPSRAALCGLLRLSCSRAGLWTEDSRKDRPIISRLLRDLKFRTPSPCPHPASAPGRGCCSPISGFPLAVLRCSQGSELVAKWLRLPLCESGVKVSRKIVNPKGYNFLEPRICRSSR